MALLFRTMLPRKFFLHAHVSADCIIFHQVPTSPPALLFSAITVQNMMYGIIVLDIRPLKFLQNFFPFSILM